MRANLVQVKFYDPKSESKQNQSVNVINLFIFYEFKSMDIDSTGLPRNCLGLTSRNRKDALNIKNNMV